MGSQENSVICSKGLFQNNKGHDNKSRPKILFNIRHIRIKILLLSFKTIHFLNERTGKIHTYSGKSSFAEDTKQVPLFSNLHLSEQQLEDSVRTSKNWESL